jgi:hypothetical protein
MEKPPAPTDDHNDGAVSFAGALTVRDAYEAVHIAKKRSEILSDRLGTACLAIILVVATGYGAYAFYNSERIALLYQQFPSHYVIFARTKFASDQDWRRFLQIVSKKLSLR